MHQHPGRTKTVMMLECLPEELLIYILLFLDLLHLIQCLKVYNTLLFYYTVVFQLDARIM
jgi:hypothetical protein